MSVYTCPNCNSSLSNAKIVETDETALIKTSSENDKMDIKSAKKSKINKIVWIVLGVGIIVAPFLGSTLGELTYENSLKNNNIVRTESIINSNQQLSSGNSSASFDSLWEDEPAQSASDSTAFNDSSANNSVATSSEAETVSSNPKQSSEQNIDVGVGNDFETTQI